MHRHCLAFFALLAPLAAQSVIEQSAFDTPNYLAGTSTGGPNLMIAIKATAPFAYAANRIEIFTGNAHGQNGVAIWNHDAANNRPQTQLAIGTWGMSSIRGWQGANLSGPVPLSLGQTFWIVWSCVNGSQSSIEGSGSGAQEYRGSFDGGATWNGPFQSYQWKFRVWGGGQPGQYEAYGSGCAGSNRGTPELGWNGIPDLGLNLDILLARGLPSSSAFMAIGDSDSSWLANPLPYDLAPQGAPGCLVRASVATSLFRPIDAAGNATATLSIPANPALLAFRFFDQWWVLDAAANPLGLVVSNGGAGAIGF